MRLCHRCFCRPIFELLRLVDGGKPVMGKVYHEFYQVQQHIEGLKGMPEERREQVKELFLTRWNQGHSHLHGAGYALDPEFRKHDFDQEVSDLALLWHLLLAMH